MRHIWNTIRQRSRLLFVLCVVAPILGMLSIQATLTQDATMSHEPHKIYGTKYNLVTYVRTYESADNYTLFIIEPKTPFDQLNGAFANFIAAKTAEFKSSLVVGKVPKGFRNQLSITPRIDYIDDNTASVTLQTEEYRTNQSTVVTYQSWQVYNNTLHRFTVDDSNVKELAAALGTKKEDMSNLVGKQLSLSVLPNLSFRFYTSADYAVPGQYVTIPFSKMPKLATVYLPSYFAQYDKIPTKEDLTYISKVYAKRFGKHSIAEDTCAYKKCVALTFDDGPDEAVTSKLLDELKARSVKATFFVLGKQVVRYPELLKRTHDEGHEIENHSYDHPDFVKLKNLTKIRQQIDLTQKAIQDIGLTAPIYMRPPYGSVNPQIENAIAMPIILWNVDAQEWRTGTSPQTVASAIAEKTRTGSIVLLHDTRTVTADTLPSLLEDLYRRDYKFVTVQDLLGVGAEARAIYDSAP